jgi:hypothetical protein
MRITFDDQSYIECYKPNDPNKVIFIISAKDQENPRKKTTNAVEITMDEFKQLIANVAPDIGFYVQPPKYIVEK